MISAVRTILVLLLVLVAIGCEPSISDEMYHYGPDRESDIVFYFNRGTTNEQINDFLDNQLSDPQPSGGHWPKPGVEVTFMVRAQDFEGYAITLRPDATDEERGNILGVLNKSPLIYKVFENITPNNIILDSAKAKKELKELEKSKDKNRTTEQIVTTVSPENR